MRRIPGDTLVAFLKKFMHEIDKTMEERELRDIVDNLNNVLNTKKGYGAFVDDFGIRDMNEYSTREFIADAILQEVRQAITKYEPRLDLVKIEILEEKSSFRISFRIECHVKKTQKFLHMEFDSVYNSFSIEPS